MSEPLNPCWCGAPAKQKRNGFVMCALVSRHGYAYDAEEWNRRAPDPLLALVREAFVAGAMAQWEGIGPILGRKEAESEALRRWPDAALAEPQKEKEGNRENT